MESSPHLEAGLVEDEQDQLEVRITLEASLKEGARVGLVLFFPAVAEALQLGGVLKERVVDAVQGADPRVVVGEPDELGALPTDEGVGLVRADTGVASPRSRTRSYQSWRFSSSQ